MELVKQLGEDEFQFTLRETQTQNVLDDIQTFKSELGVIYLNDFNTTVLTRLIHEKDLQFIPFILKPNPTSSSAEKIH